jgi:hypothetical protein
MYNEEDGHWNEPERIYTLDVLMGLLMLFGSFMLFVLFIYILYKGLGLL